MSTPGSPRKQPPASPARGHKRKASEASEAFEQAGPSTGQAVSASPTAGRRNSRQIRTFQVAEDFDEDAPYDQDLDADGEYDEEWMEQDAEGEDDGIVMSEIKAQEDVEAEQVEEAMSPRKEATSARPKRSNAPSVSYYDIPPLPPSDDDEEEEEVEQPVIKKRGRGRPRKHPLPTSDIEMDQTPAKASSRTTPMGKTPRRPPAAISDHDPSPSNLVRQRSAKPEEPEMTEEQKAAARAEKEAEDLRSRWTEEYFEIVEQLPLEVHRTFALMRELEGQMQTRLNGMVQNMVSYRDARSALQRVIDDPSSRGRKEREGSEDEAENLLGGSQTETVDTAVIELGEDVVVGKAERRELLRTIANAANESVKAAEEKMGLAATAYNWIDRHIRRLDADIGKLESSILLGLRTGTEESRGAREALGLPVDEEAADDTQDAERGDAKPVSAEAESASLTKAAGAASRATKESTRKSGRRSTTTTPKMGGQAQLPATSPGADSKRSRSRSRSAASTTTGDKPSTSAHRLNRKTTKSPSPTPPPTRGNRKRKPKPLSPQKGGRRSIVTPQITSPSSASVALPVVGPDTSEMPFDPTEPTYCYCDQISFDEMVACENEDCAIEWFHFACVGLTSQPKAEWYCRFCASPGWKGPGMDVPTNAKHKPPGWKKGVGIKP